MYRAHFGLSEQPFALTPNTHFFLNAQAHREAFNMLQVALSSGEGFIKVVGEVGTGKTMLCRQLLNTLQEGYYTAYIPNPFLTPVALYKALAQELGIKIKTRDGINELQKAINERLVELVAQGLKVVLVIDEAQALAEKTLEALRLISNLETESLKLLHIVLFGQPELDQLLAQDSLRQLRQRIGFSCRLLPLDKEGCQQYVAHRLAAAGYNGDPLFTDKALGALYKASGGVPRLINILAHKALMSAYGKGSLRVELEHMRASIADTESVNGTLDQGARYRLWAFAALVFIGVAVSCLLLLPGEML